MEKAAIPPQRKGAHFDVKVAEQMKDREEAVYHYTNCREKLLHVSLWGTYSGDGPEVFILTDAEGNQVHRAGEVGDHVKIHLPGPRSFKGDGADWVRVERIYEDRNKQLDEVMTAITLRPCANPCLKDNEIAHFYDDQSTNTILVCRHKIEISASAHGRNELINTETDWLDQVRNLAVGLPAKAGLSTPHWKKLAKGLIC
jgi:hypothetical protein